MSPDKRILCDVFAAEVPFPWSAHPSGCGSQLSSLILCVQVHGISACGRLPGHQQLQCREGARTVKAGKHLMRPKWNHAKRANVAVGICKAPTRSLRGTPAIDHHSTALRRCPILGTGWMRSSSTFATYLVDVSNSAQTRWISTLSSDPKILQASQPGDGLRVLAALRIRSTLKSYVFCT